MQIDTFSKKTNNEIQNRSELFAKFEKIIDQIKDGDLLINIPEYTLPMFADSLAILKKVNVGINIFDKNIADVNKVDIEVKNNFDFRDLGKWDLKRVERVWEKGEYSILGDVVTLFPFSENNPIRISLFGNEVESIEVIDVSTKQSIRGLKEYTLNSSKDLLREYKSSNYGEFSTTIQLNYILNIDDSIEKSFSNISIDIGVKSIPSLELTYSMQSLSNLLDSYMKSQYEVIVVYSDQESLEKFKEDERFNSYKFVKYKNLQKGFIIPSLKLLLITEQDIVGEVDLSTTANVLDNNSLFKKFVIGDYIVHEDHGVGVFNGVARINGGSYLEVKYARNDRLLIPFNQANKVTKYVGSAKHKPIVTTLSSGLWNRIKVGIKHNVKLLASDLLKLYAMRELARSPIIISSDADREQLFDFAKSFKYPDTEDQTLITKEIANDLSKPEPMDRLIVGDVGFGKTEIAVRAAFACLNAGYQVAVLAPTTILANQHLKTFSDRLGEYAFRVEGLSRLKDKGEQKNIIEGISNGKVDLVIGTHRLLQDDIRFKNLGLLIIDEEQRFGVAQKEKLKNKSLDVNILSTTATPIPRTLNLALSGARDLSILASIPRNRQQIINKFEEFNWESVISAISKEIERGGQAYYLHNKVADIYNIQEELKVRMPSIKFAVAHGQLKPKILNKIMNQFINNEIDVLISTTIIENGLDLPNVNTLIVDEASMYGLSQLYQIRGRIGRSDKQAYAYFMYKSLKGDATLRLDALSESSDLGAGFILSTKDLEIRGAGNILGKDQSGSINSIGYGLYIQMLNEELDRVKALRNLSNTSI